MIGFANCAAGGVLSEALEGSVEARLASADAGDGKRTAPEGDVSDTSGTATRKRDRAPVRAGEGGMDPDIPMQTQEKRCRVGDLPAAFEADREVVNGYVPWWHQEVKSRLGAQARKDLLESVFADGPER